MSNEPTNSHEYSVSELSGALKNTIEDNFSFVRVRGELGRVVRAGSGHMYMDLKDDRAVINGVVWKGVAARLAIEPEQGMEVVASGRMTTFAGQSRYQIIIDAIEPAGAGALMALYEKRKKQLASEGLFATERKKDLPFIPSVIGVVTSPSGAVIRDILHRLHDRFPTRVLVWPTLVQGKQAEKQIIAAIKGFNRLEPDAKVPRPDVIIVARGGGSLEDLWCFNEEGVARAAAASDIPLISAVGHETDTTLIDYVADQRAPTPTAAAEMATPVRTELMSEIVSKERRLLDAQTRVLEAARAGLLAAERGIGRPEDLIGASVQRLDRAGDRLASALRARLDRARHKYGEIGVKLMPNVLSAGFENRNGRILRVGERLSGVMKRVVERRHDRLDALSLGGEALHRSLQKQSQDMAGLGTRLKGSGLRALERQHVRLKGSAKLLSSLSHHNVLERGFALVRNANGDLIRQVQSLEEGEHGSLELKDGIRNIIFSKQSSDRPLSPSNTKKRAGKKANEAPALKPSAKATKSSSITQTGKQKSLFD